MFSFLKKKVDRLKEGVRGTLGRPEKEVEEAGEKRGLGEKIVGAARRLVEEKTLGEKSVDPLLEEFELDLLQANVASEVAEKICGEVRKELVGKNVKRGGEGKAVERALKKALEDLLEESDLKLEGGEAVMFVGVNGAGKTTVMAKIAKRLQDKGQKVVFAAADTFRAAAIEQLEKHAKNLGIKVVKHDYGSDAAAVAYDAISHARKEGAVALIDTAGRMHSNRNLMEELRKIKRVNKIDYTIFVGDALTGNDATEQARTFDKEVGIDGIVLCKADVDEKGGAAISVSEVTGKPILFLGTGQGYGDIEPFSKKKLLSSLGFQ